jgi:hypothetical protein
LELVPPPPSTKYFGDMLDLISNLFFPSKYGDFGPFFHAKKKKNQLPMICSLKWQNFLKTMDSIECFFPHFFQQKKGENL